MQHSRVSCIRPPHPTPPKHTRTHTSQRSAALTLVPAAFGVLSTALTSGEYRVAKGHNPLTMRAHANNTLSQTPVSGFPQAARPHSWEEDAPEYDCSLGSRRPNPFQSVTAASWKRIGGWGGRGATMVEKQDLPLATDERELTPVCWEQCLYLSVPKREGSEITTTFFLEPKTSSWCGCCLEDWKKVGFEEEVVLIKLCRKCNYLDGSGTSPDILSTS